MRSLTILPFLLRGALVALLVVVAAFSPRNQGVEAALLSEVKKLLASDGQADDFFGFSVAVGGDTAVVGAIWEDAGGSKAGAAYVFQRDESGEDNWGEVKKLTASDAQAGDQFGNSVAVSGDTALVGANNEDAESGAAYVFGRDEGGIDNWGQVKKLTASDAQAGDQFGWSVALSGDSAVVGALTKDAAEDSNAGAAYVFERDEGGADNWGEVTKLTASDAQADDFFGSGVAVASDTVVVGATFKNGFAGAAYVFGRDEGGPENWGEVRKLTASDAQADDFFGFSVTVSGAVSVVGALGEDAEGSLAGAAYVFGRDEGGADNWGEVKKLTASDAQAGDRFGKAVAVSGDALVVGAHHKDGNGNTAGAAYVFHRGQGGAEAWGEVTKLTASDAQARDQFGISVALSAQTAVIGANQDTGTNPGAAYIFGPAAVGGIAEHPDIPETSLDAAETSGASTRVVAGFGAAIAAGVLALGGVGWYAGRRLR